MLDLLIFCNDLSSAKLLINKIINNIKAIKIIGIANTLNEALELTQKFEPILIITTNIDLIILMKKNFLFYSPKIILISNSINKNLNSNNCLQILKNMDYKSIVKEIIEFINENSICSEREKIIKLLSSLGFNFKLTGTIFLIDAILYAISNEKSQYFDILQKDIYSYVANLHNTNSNIVKWSITRSINYMYKEKNNFTYKNIENYFGIKYPNKLTPKLLINYISNKLQK